MKNELGFMLVHPIGGEDEGYVKVIAVRENIDAPWQIDPEFSEEPDALEFMYDTLENEVLFGEMDWEGEYLTFEQIKEEYDYEKVVNWRDFITEEQFKERQEVSRKIIDILKLHGLDTNDLIVSDGQVFQGYSQCSDFIQTTHTWCSSSMSC